MEVAMPEFVPIDLDNVPDIGSKAVSFAESAGNQPVDLRPSAGLLAKIRSGQIQVPGTLAELTNADTLIYSLSVNAAASLGIPLGKIQMEGKVTVFVQDFAQYEEIIDGVQKVRYGITIRYAVAFRQLAGSFNISTMPAIAAAAQLNFAEATAKFSVLGMTSARIVKAIPVVPKLDVEAYTLFAQSMKDIKDLIFESDTVIKPAVLAVLAN
jgi:hypothetical protein